MRLLSRLALSLTCVRRGRRDGAAISAMRFIEVVHGLSYNAFEHDRISDDDLHQSLGSELELLIEIVFEEDNEWVDLAEVEVEDV